MSVLASQNESRSSIVQASLDQFPRSRTRRPCQSNLTSSYTTRLRYTPTRLKSVELTRRNWLAGLQHRFERDAIAEPLELLDRTAARLVRGSSGVVVATRI